MKHMRMIALLLALVLAFGLAACGNTVDNPTGTPTGGVTGQPTGEPTGDPTGKPTGDPTGEPTGDPTGEPTGDPVGDPDGDPTGAVRFAVLSGPTGIGAAKLLSDADQGLSSNNYKYFIAADNSELVAGLTNGEIDIATVASNVALNLYNKTDGGVMIIALGTQGVLHILEGSGGTTVNSIEDLEGEVIYSAGQGANPEYILRYLLTQVGLDPDNDVTIVFEEAGVIQNKLLSGEIKYAMLPVPAATAAIVKGGGQVRSAIDVTEAWSEVGGGSQLIMTAVVARTAFVKANPEAIAAFLAEYEASIEYVNGNPAEAAQLIAGYGITPNAVIAEQAIPQCHLVYIDGAAMAPAISDYYMVLYGVNPASVGGKLPDDGIYYVP